MGTMIVRSVEQMKQILSSQPAEEAGCPERWPWVHVHEGPWPPALLLRAACLLSQELWREPTGRVSGAAGSEMRGVS